MEPKPKNAQVGSATIPWEATGLNLPENSDSSKQQEILDALPVLIFLEQAGKIVFANTEARQMLGLTEGEWVERPVEDVLWGLFPGTAEPQTLLTGTKKGSPFHATMPAKNGKLLPVEGTYSILDAENARGGDRGAPRRTGTGAEVAADGRCAGQYSRGRGD